LQQVMDEQKDVKIMQKSKSNIERLRKIKRGRVKERERD
jgi:hypothetical protein